MFILLSNVVSHNIDDSAAQSLQSTLHASKDTIYTIFTVLTTKSGSKHTDSTNKPSVFSNKKKCPQPHIGKGITCLVTGDPYITCEAVIFRSL